MQEMLEWHKGRWGAKATEAPADEPYEFTDSASALKRHLMCVWERDGKQLCRAGDPLWSKSTALWERIALQRLRFMGSRQWYVVARAFDKQRRMLVLAVPPKRQTAPQRALQREVAALGRSDECSLHGRASAASRAVAARGSGGGYVRPPLRPGFHPPPDLSQRQCLQRLRAVGGSQV